MGLQNSILIRHVTIFDGESRCKRDEDGSSLRMECKDRVLVLLYEREGIEEMLHTFTRRVQQARSILIERTINPIRNNSLVTTEREREVQWLISEAELDLPVA